MKNTIILTIITLATFLTPVKGLLIIISLAVGIDTIYALYSVIKTKGLKEIKSTKLFNLVVKTLFYQSTIILSYLTDVYILEGAILGIPFLISKVVCVVWLSIELKSIDETNQKLGNKPFIETLKSIIEKVKGFKKDLNELKK